jgi:uncharacterized protein YbjT (DUF2867 family)
MRVMLLGAGGFIGRHIMTEVLAGGHELIGVVRSIGNLALAFPQSNFLAIDLAHATDADAWRRQMDGVDIIINAAGILRGREMDAVHVDMPKAMHAAALDAGVKRVVLISAISARTDVNTDYSISKLAGEEALRSSGLSWTVLRPSLVYGDGSYGGTSLLRGIAAFPLFVAMPGAGNFAFTPIHVRDLARTVRTVFEDAFYAHKTLEPVGPETICLRDLLEQYRIWLGFGHAKFLHIPMSIMRLMGRIGDVAGDGPIATNSVAQMVAGNAGDSAVFAKAIGFSPRRLGDALRDHPAQVQDRWHARLFFLAPAMKIALVLMWLSSAWLGLFHGMELTETLIRKLGLPMGFADPLRIGSSFLDIAIAGLLVFDRKTQLATFVQLAAVIGYTLVIGFALPQLWLDPLGPLLKNIPILLAIAVHGAIGDQR